MDAAGPSGEQIKPSTFRGRARRTRKYDLNIMKSKTNELFGKKMKNDRATGMKYEYADDSKVKYVAEKWRADGIALFKEERYRESILMFTRSVASAPSNSEELATAYAHRSSALFRLREYETCILDINRAIQAGCSESLKKQLRKRKMDCLKQRQLAANTKETGHALPPINSDATDSADLFGLHDSKYLERSRVFTSSEIFDGEVNDLLPQTLSKIELVYDEQSGARMVAKEDLAAGEFLSIEEFFVMELDYEKRVYHCSYCFSRCDSLIPCPTCLREMYCSYYCQKRAYESYHRVECQIVMFYEREGAEWRDTLIMRAFLLATKQGDEFHALMEKVKLENIFQKADPPKLPFVNDLSTAFDIMRTCRMFDDDGMVLHIEEVLNLAVDAVIALRSISFFGNTSCRKTLTEEELFTAIFLAKNYVLLGWGTFKINAQTKKNMTGEHHIGYGVNVLQNFYLYSCNPNTHGFVENRHRIAYATRTIKAGESLCFTESHAYVYQPIDKRLKRFTNQGYTCDCEACVGSWPSHDNLKKSEILFRNNVTSRELIKAMRDLLGKKLYEVEESAMLKTLIHLIELLCATLKMPSYDIFICEELIVRFMNNYYSDFHWTDESLPRDFVITFNTITERLEKQS